MNKCDQNDKADKKAIISIVWIFVLFNMIYADIISLMDAGSPIRKIMGGAPTPPGGLIAGAILMETPIAMILLSRILGGKANRWINTIICAINIVAVIAGGRGQYYFFFATIETISMLFIVWVAWSRPNGGNLEHLR